MTTVTEAWNIIRGRIEANPPTSNGDVVILRWQGERGDPLPDSPSPLVYTEFNPDLSAIVGYGAGRGQNLYRNTGVIDSYCFVPNDWGLTYATDIAEQVAALFRSYRDEYISCFDASVFPLGHGSTMKPPGLESEVDNYYAATTQVSMFFDFRG